VNISSEKNKSLSNIEQITIRPYYLMVTCLDTIQTVAKVVTLVFSLIITGAHFGKSKVMNRWCVVHAKDVLISIKLTKLAMIGIFKPLHATNERIHLSEQGAHSHCKFDYTLIDNTKYYEKFGMSLQFLVNAFKETMNFIICGLRYAGTLAVKSKKIKSEVFDRISDDEFCQLSAHGSFAFDSAEGVFFPKKKHYVLVKPS